MGPVGHYWYQGLDIVTSRLYKPGTAPFLLAKARAHGHGPVPHAWACGRKPMPHVAAASVCWLQHQGKYSTLLQEGTFTASCKQTSGLLWQQPARQEGHRQMLTARACGSSYPSAVCMQVALDTAILGPIYVVRSQI